MYKRQVYLGTNGAFADDQFDQVMQQIGPESTVFFITVNVPRPWEASVNDALARGVARWPNAHLLDWKDAARSHAEWFTNDGFHLTPPGAAAFAAFVRDGIRA